MKNAKYWNELSDEEKENMYKEWYKSNWYQQSLKECYSVRETSASVCLVIGTICLGIMILIGIILVIAGAFNNTELFDSIVPIAFIVIFLNILIGFPSIIANRILQKIIGKKREKYLDNEEKKWLLKNYSIIK